jgi:hypothetical protein
MLFTVQTIYVEIMQMIFHKAEYFQSFWNILDLLVVVMQPIIVILNVLDPSDESDALIRPLMSICLTIFYTRFFYFLRIFDASGPLVAIIVEITAEIKVFILIFLMGIVGFGTSFYILSNNNVSEGQEQFIPMFPQAMIYAYRMSVGDFQLDGFDKS